MHLSRLERNFEKRRERTGMTYALGSPAAPSAIEAAESRLDVSLPRQVRLFYEAVNGFAVEQPAIRVLELEALERAGDAIRFALIDREHHLVFDVSEINEAGQWTVRNEIDGYAVTLTFASFWSNKIWAWIDKRRPIWREEVSPVVAPHEPDDR